MITISKLKLSLFDVAFSEKVILTKVSDQMEYQNGKLTEKQIGIKYHVVAANNEFEKFIVNVAGLNPVITNREIEQHEGNVEIRFNGFEGKFWRNKEGDYIFSAKADSAEIVE